MFSAAKRSSLAPRQPASWRLAVCGDENIWAILSTRQLHHLPGPRYRSDAVSDSTGQRGLGEAGIWLFKALSQGVLIAGMRPFYSIRRVA
jgi:hypothetical protein